MQRPTLDTQTNNFLRLLWRGGKWAYYGLFDEAETYATADGTQEKVKSFYWFPADRIMPLPRGDTAHYYFGVFTSGEKRSNKQRALSSTIDSAGAAFAEYDIKDYGTRAAIDARIANLPLQPSVIINSAGDQGGVHCYWLLDTPYLMQTDEQRQSYRTFMRRWVAFCEADDVKDLTRVLRIPGTRNLKPSYEHADGTYPIVSFARYNLEHRYSLSELQAVLPPAPPIERADAAPRRVYSGDSVIDRYNADTPIWAALESAGYKRRGSRYTYDDSASVNSSIVILDDTASYHWDSSDPLADDHAHTSFDVFCQRQHGGDVAAAVKAAASELGISRDYSDPVMQNGVACCPYHTNRKLKAANNGNGYRCSKLLDDGTFCQYWWKGDGYTMPEFSPNAARTQPEIRQLGAVSPVMPNLQPMKFLTVDDMLARPKTEWLIDGLIARRQSNMLFAQPGTGKSLLAVDVNAALASSLDELFVYVIGEAEDEYPSRLEAWVAFFKMNPKNFFFLAQPVNLADPQYVAHLIESLKSLSAEYGKPIGMVTIDTLRASMPGFNEKEQQDMSIATNALAQIRRSVNTTAWLIHHAGWDATHESGSSSLRGDVRVVAKLANHGVGGMKLTIEKNNQGELGKAKFFSLVESCESVVMVPSGKMDAKTQKLSDNAYQFLAVLDYAQYKGEGATQAEITEAVGCAKSTTSGLVNQLMQKGYIRLAKRARSSVYTLLQAGRDELDLYYAGQSDTSDERPRNGLNWSGNVSAVPPTIHRTQPEPSAEYEPNADRTSPEQCPNNARTMPEQQPNQASQRHITGVTVASILNDVGCEIDPNNGMRFVRGFDGDSFGGVRSQFDSEPQQNAEIRSTFGVSSDSSGEQFGSSDGFSVYNTENRTNTNQTRRLSKEDFRIEETSGGNYRIRYTAAGNTIIDDVEDHDEAKELVAHLAATAQAYQPKQIAPEDAAKLATVEAWLRNPTPAPPLVHASAITDPHLMVQVLHRITLLL